MTTQEKARAAIYHYKELNTDLSFRFDNNTMFELQNQEVEKTLCFLALHADCILIADTFTGRRFFNLAENWDVIYEFISYLNRYDFKYCKTQIYLKCDLEIQALLIAVSSNGL